MSFKGAVQVTTAFPVKAGEVVFAGQHLFADPAVGVASAYATDLVHVGAAVFGVDNIDGGDGDKLASVCVLGLITDEVSDFTPGTDGIGSDLYADANGLPVINNATGVRVGRVVSLDGGKRVTYLIII